MRKLLLLLLFALAVWLIWKSRRARARPRSPQQQPDGERMVRCAQCGVYLPVSAAIEANKRHFCSLEHQRAMKR